MHEDLHDAAALGESVPLGTTILFMPQVAASVLPASFASESDKIPLTPEADQPPAPKRVAKPHAEKLTGKTLGVYRCDTLLGRGAMGAVYLAFHQQLERRCALKVLSPKYVETDADYVNRFRQEAIAAANLHHPNVVMAYAVGNHDGLH